MNASRNETIKHLLLDLREPKPLQQLPTAFHISVMVSPVVGEVLQTALDETHADLTVSEPADQRAQQLLCLIDQAF